MIEAIKVRRYGGPEVLQLQSVELPSPAPNEVRVRQRAVGVNFLDIYQRAGRYRPAELPFILGSEAAGEIVAIGKSVRGYEVGNRVAYFASLGCYATERNVPEHLLLKLPPTISDELAAAMLLKGLTAEYLLHRSYVVKAGDVVLIQAAAGGVGLFLSQWAKLLGATVIGTVGSEQKAALARRNGCDHVILYRRDNFVDRVKELTSGSGCHVVYDGVGKDTLSQSFECLRSLGTLVHFGSASGAIERLDMSLLGKGSTFLTRPAISTFIARRDWLEEMFANLVAVTTSGKLDVLISLRGKLKDAADAHEQLEARKTSGSIVLLP